MTSAVHDRRSFLVAVAGLTILAGLAAARARMPPPPVPQLDLAQARALIDAGALVIDARGQEQFDQRHLPSAISLPLSVLQAEIPAWLAASKDRAIVVYCRHGVGTGPAATAILRQAGFTHAANLTAGIEGWKAADLPLANGRA